MLRNKLNRMDLFAVLERYDCRLMELEREHLLQLSDVKFGILEECVYGLQKAGLLNAKTFHEVYIRKMFHIGKVKPSSVTRLPGIEYAVMKFDGGPKLFTPAKYRRVASGDYGSITEGFTQKPADQDVAPDWAIKTLHDYEHSSQEEVLKSAKREVRCNRLLQRQAYYFRSGKESVCLALEWQHGVTVYALRNNMHQFSFARRLQWLITLLEDIVKLHQQFVVHKDLHSENVIVDTQANKASLIDLGKAHKTGPGWSDMAVDLTNLSGNIMSYLFSPEITKLKLPYATAIQRLDSALNTGLAVCTSQQALSYCRLLLENVNALSEKVIDEIALKTLDRKNLTVDDVLSGCNRPLTMRK